jgi:hypothetical protein
MIRRFSSAVTAGLLGAPLGLLVLLPVAPVMAQVQAGIPADVQGWFDAAKAAASKGDGAEALRLQKQVLAWLAANLLTGAIWPWP